MTMSEKQKEKLIEILLGKVEKFSEYATTAEEVEALSAVAQVLLELSRD